MPDYWHGYILVKRPRELDSRAWVAVEKKLIAELDCFPKARQPAHRLHVRRNLETTKIIIEARFDQRRITFGALCELIGGALPGYSADAVLDMFSNEIAVFCEGTTWAASRNAVRGLIAADVEDWERDNA